ncbi:MAG: hypothetical protein RR291_06195, partial [Clostridia bacterium]
KIVNFNTTDIPDKLNTASALNAVLSNVVMAHTSIETAVPYVKNSEFVDNLKQQIARYKDYEIQARDLADKVGVTLTPHGKMSRFMIQMAIKMKLITDSSDSNIARLMLLGTINGVIDLKILVNHTKNIESNAVDLVKKVLYYEEDKTESSKRYL